MINLVGLPGLYQNWLTLVLDTSAEYKQHYQNWNVRSNSVRTLRKCTENIHGYNLSLDDVKPDYCTYVSNENFVWYLYNFFEKVDDIFVSIENFVEDIDSKARDTEAMDTIYNHMLSTYGNIESNSVQEYFYQAFVQDNQWKKDCRLVYDDCVLIEYDDFSKPDILHSKLGVDRNYFDAMYAKLYERNHMYIDRKQKFLKKSVQEMDWLEQSYLASTIASDLDWYNESVRQDVLDKYSITCN